MGRKPFPVRGTNFARERNKFSGSRRQIQADAMWWEPPPKMSAFDIEVRMGEVTVEIQKAKEKFAEAATEMRRLTRNLTRMRPGRVYNFESKFSATSSVKKDKDISTTDKIYYQDKTGMQVVALTFYKTSVIPDIAKLETVYGSIITVYRQGYLEFVQEFDEWERRSKYVAEDDLRVELSPTARRAQRAWKIPNNNPVDHWEIRLRLVMEAADV